MSILLLISPILVTGPYWDGFFPRTAKHTDVFSRVVPYHEYIYPQHVPGFSAQCTKPSELHYVWGPELDCLVCFCLEDLSAVCASCGGCQTSQLTPEPLYPVPSFPPVPFPPPPPPPAVTPLLPPPLSPLPPFPSSPLPFPSPPPPFPSPVPQFPQPFSPEPELPQPFPVQPFLPQPFSPNQPQQPFPEVVPSVTCSPLPVNQPFQNPLNPCQVCVCQELLDVFGRPDVQIDCKENQQCVLPADATTLPPFVEPVPVPTATCDEFPLGVVFPHPNEVCVVCKCVLPLGYVPGKLKELVCYPNPTCESPVEPTQFPSFPGPSTPVPVLPPLPPAPAPLPPFPPVVPIVQPLPTSPPPDASICDLYSLEAPFLNPKNECQLCQCVQPVPFSAKEVVCFANPACRDAEDPALQPSSPAPPTPLVEPLVPGDLFVIPISGPSPQPFPTVNPVDEVVVPLKPSPEPQPEDYVVPVNPLPGPKPHSSCEPYTPNKPFNHPWDDCQVCVCSEGLILSKVVVEVNCYTKKSCCVEFAPSSARPALPFFPSEKPVAGPGPVYPLYVPGSQAFSTAENVVNVGGAPSNAFGYYPENSVAPGSSASADASAIVNGAIKYQPTYPPVQQNFNLVGPSGSSALANAFSKLVNAEYQNKPEYQPSYPSYTSEGPDASSSVAKVYTLANGGFGQNQPSPVELASPFLVNGGNNPFPTSFQSVGQTPSVGYVQELLTRPDGASTAADSSAVVNVGYNQNSYGYQTGSPQYYSTERTSVSSINADTNGVNVNSQYLVSYQPGYSSYQTVPPVYSTEETVVLEPNGGFNQYVSGFQSGAQPIHSGSSGYFNTETPSESSAAADTNTVVNVGYNKYYPSSSYPDIVPGSFAASDASAVVSGGNNYQLYPDVVPTTDAVNSGYNLFQPGHNSEYNYPSYAGYSGVQGSNAQVKAEGSQYTVLNGPGYYSNAKPSYSSYQFQPGYYPGYVPPSSAADASAQVSSGYDKYQYLGYGYDQQQSKATANAGQGQGVANSNLYTFGSLPPSSQALAEAEAKALASHGNGNAFYGYVAQNPKPYPGGQVANTNTYTFGSLPLSSQALAEAEAKALASYGSGNAFSNGPGGGGFGGLQNQFGGYKELSSAYSQVQGSGYSQASATSSVKSGPGQCKYDGDMYHEACQVCYCHSNDDGSLYFVCKGERCQ